MDSKVILMQVPAHGNSVGSPVFFMCLTGLLQVSLLGVAVPFANGAFKRFLSPTEPSNGSFHQRSLQTVPFVNGAFKRFLSQTEPSNVSFRHVSDVHYRSRRPALFF
ncbi:unnamed protein product [Schistocephalus solidus]|uniref:Secreted protein n=1 Tax=Schistocephalus solidus TaxID=70667 RepID=A0A183TQT8_SCHSO|nr:unnamed protein product [Schistocephalus solidus]